MPVFILLRYTVVLNLVLLCVMSSPYKGKQDINFIHSLKKNTLNKILSQTVEPNFIYTETKIPAKFQIKGKTKDEYKHDLVYYGKCPECDEIYVSEFMYGLDEHSGKKIVSLTF